ncbi:hypothetical protein QJQ45_001790 [Haematococcus lacustris]|nr:hypothetical protein QJQ45_001790 [Haematococcus lacustris]
MSMCGYFAWRQPKMQQQQQQRPMCWDSPNISKALVETREFVLDPATQIGVGIDPGVTLRHPAVAGTNQAPPPAPGSSQLSWHLLEEDMAEVSMERHLHSKQLVVFFGAVGIGTRGGWGADAVLRACCKVVCRPKGIGQRRGRVVLEDEHHTSQVSSAMNSPQPCEKEMDRSKPTRPEDWKPQPGQVQHRLLRSAWSKRFKAPVRGLMWCPKLDQATPRDIDKWVDRDCNTALTL